MTIEKQRVNEAINWCAENYGGEWNNGLETPKDWIWASTQFGVVLIHHTGRDAWFIKENVGDKEIRPPVLAAPIGWCAENYNGSWNIMLKPPKDWIWAWDSKGVLILRQFVNGDLAITEFSLKQIGKVGDLKLKDESRNKTVSYTLLDPAKSKEDLVNHPKHYTRHPSGVECIEITEHMTLCVGSAMKYLWRAGEKQNKIEDLEKAAWYIQREIERLKQ